MEQYTLATPGCNATTQQSAATAALPCAYATGTYAVAAGTCSCSRYTHMQQVYAYAAGICICSRYMHMQQVYAHATGMFTCDRYMDCHLPPHCGTRMETIIATQKMGGGRGGMHVIYTELHRYCCTNSMTHCHAQPGCTHSAWVDARWIDARWINAKWIDARWIDAMWIDAMWIDAMWIDARWIDARWICMTLTCTAL